MRSALFIDFDNVFTQLRQLQPEVAERFARDPAEWLRWLVESLELPRPHADAAQRRLLVRRCYLNPNWYQNYRHSFLRAGFEIVDCPPVTSQGKTSTDIHMVLDIIELLQQQETRYDEFIVFSADADFTPVLRKLRRHDRRTTVLAIGFPSAAYQASADLMIDERLFIQNALGFAIGTEAEGEAPEAGAQAVLPLHPVGERFTPLRPHAPPTGRFGPLFEVAPPVQARAATPEELTAIAARIVLTVEQSTTPVSAGRMAARIKQEFPQVAEEWNGLGSFKQFFRSLELPGLLWAVGSGGRLYDPTRHQIDPESDAAAAVLAASAEPGPGWNGDVGLFKLARDVSYYTGTPLLTPADLRVVLELLSDDLGKHPFELSATAQRVGDGFLERQGAVLSLRDASFLIRGMQLNGHHFGVGQDDVATLARRLFNQVLFLCEREQMSLDDEAIGHIRRWIGGDLLG